MSELRFEEGDLIEYVHLRPHLHLHLHLRPRLHLHPRPRPRPRLNTLAIVVKMIKASEAWENYEAGDPNCYIVEWQKDGEQSLVFEGEIE